MSKSELFAYVLSTEPQGDVRALTVKQPFAWGLLNRKKPVENRTWGHRRKWPRWVLLHASDQVATPTTKTKPIIDALHVAGCHDCQLPTRAILGAIHIQAVVAYDELDESSKLAYGPHALPGQKIWIVDDTIVLNEKWPCSGGLSLWKVKHC